MTKSDRYLQTKTLQANLGERSLQSGLIALTAQPLKLIIGIGATALLARLLAPADFGLLAMVQPLLDMVDSLNNLGLETATVQQEELDQDQASAIFWLSCKINALIIVGMIACAPLLVWFYKETALAGIVVAMAVGVASVSLSFQHFSLLKRQMRFALLTGIEVVAIAISVGTAVVAAWMGAGYWALVLQLVVLQFVKSVAYWIFCDWRPHRLSQTAQQTVDLRQAIAYGANLTGFRFVSRIGLQMDRILLGYVGGPGALGLYSMAYQWAYFPFRQIYYPLFDVAVSSFSRSFADPERYRAYCRRGLMPIFAVCMPALACLFVTAPDVILLLLGDQWSEAVPLFRVLAIAVFAGMLYRVTKWIYVSSGTTQRQLRWSFIHTPVMILAVAIGVRWGAYGVAVGYAVGSCLLAYPSVLFCIQKTPLSNADFLSAVWRPAVASMMSAVILYGLQPYLPTFGLLGFTLSLKLLVYALIYGVIWLALLGGYAEARSVITLFLARK